MRVTPVIRVGISVGVVAIILWRVPVYALWSALQYLDGSWLLAALASALATLAIRTLKWQRLLRSAGFSASGRNVMKSLFGGFALGVVTPGRLGEFGRCLFIPEAERGAVISLNVLDRFLDSWSVATYMVVSLFLTTRWPGATLALAVWMVTIPLVLGLPRLISRLGESPWWGKILGSQLRNADPGLGKAAMGTFAAWALLSTTLDVITFYFLLRAFHPIDIMTAPATYPWIVMASGIPLSLGGLGLREGASVVLLSHYGVTAALATDVALLLFAFLSLLPALIGGIFLLLERIGEEVRPAPLGKSRLRRSHRENLGLSEEKSKASQLV